jgi:predicted short-subunit dehydrogenase-like oxidoreductase (DUF2520 family)
MEVSIVGAGRVGTALGVRLREAGHRIVAVSGRAATAERARRFLPGVPVIDPAEAARRAVVVLIATPDDRIIEACKEVASAWTNAEGRFVAHVSGATGLDALEAVGALGATILSVHPLQSFPTVELALDRLGVSGIAVTARADDGFALGERLARDVGGRPFRLADEDKPLYHAAAVFASNYLVAVLSIAEELFGRVGLDRELFLPLARASLANAAATGAALALTGPAIRGDAGTVERNLRALDRVDPSCVPVYTTLAAVALDLGERSGRLAPAGRRTVEEVLERWR